MLLTGHFQNAYITRDLDHALAQFRDRYDDVVFKTFDSTIEVTTPAGTGPATFRTALGWVGKLQYELIQPVSGLVDIYAGVLPSDKSLRFHHVCMRTPDFFATRAQIEKQGLRIVYERATEGVKFLYADGRDMFGHYLEYVEMPQDLWTALGGH